MLTVCVYFVMEDTEKAIGLAGMLHVIVCWKVNHEKYWDDQIGTENRG